MANKKGSTKLMKELAEFEKKLLEEILTAAKIEETLAAARKPVENSYVITVPKTFEVYKMQMGPKNAIANMTLRLPTYYAYASAQNYNKRTQESPGKAGFA